VRETHTHTEREERERERERERRVQEKTQAPQRKSKATKYWQKGGRNVIGRTNCKREKRSLKKRKKERNERERERREKERHTLIMKKKKG